jgi:hypothetical protein
MKNSMWLVVHRLFMKIIEGLYPKTKVAKTATAVLIVFESIPKDKLKRRHPDKGKLNLANCLKKISLKDSQVDFYLI